MASSDPLVQALSTLYFLAFFAVVLAVYLLPSIIAFWRGLELRWPLLIINLFGGFTLVGWIFPLAYAVAPRHTQSRRFWLR